MRWEERVGRRIRLKDLHTLEVIAEAGSMAKASERLALSQPAISKAIADMEHTFGVPLFDRSPRGVELTDAGLLLISHARVIFDELRQGVSEIERLGDATRGVVRVGTTEPLTNVVSDIICHMLRAYPRITYEVTVSDTDTLGRLLRDRALDVLITRWVAPLVADDLAAAVLYQSSLAVMASKDHRRASSKRLRLNQLLDEMWTLSPPDSFLGRIVVDLFQHKGIEMPRAVVTTLSIYMRLGLLASGQFLTILPRTALRHPANRSWMRELNVDLGDSTAPIAAITIKKRRVAGPVRLFQEASSQLCSEIESWKTRQHRRPSQDPQ
jgi:DNA-binding transcriptional LysR family regulator